MPVQKSLWIKASAKCPKCKCKMAFTLSHLMNSNVSKTCDLFNEKKVTLTRNSTQFTLTRSSTQKSALFSWRALWRSNDCSDWQPGNPASRRRFRPLRTLWKHWSDHSRTISKQHKGRQLGFVKMQAQLFFKNLQMYIRWTHTNSPPTHLIHYYYCCSSFNVPCVLLVKLFKIYLGQDEAPVLTP